MNKGLFELTTPQHLLAKARHDLQRLRGNPLDAYAAFDFFVTARHVPDWLHPGDAGAVQRKALFDKHVELRIARHIADEAKHFIATYAQHRQVQKTWLGMKGWGSGAWSQGVWGKSYGQALYISLDHQADPATIPLGDTITPLNLSERTLAVLETIVP